MKHFLTFFFFAFLVGEDCRANGNAAPDFVNKIHLSITLSTNIVSPNSTIRVHCKLENLWTNAISIYDSGRPETDSKEFLLGPDGKETDITPDDPDFKKRTMFYQRFGPVGVGKTYEWDLLAGISDKISPGEYRLQIQRGVRIQIEKGKYRPVEYIRSNLSDVHVR